MQTGSQRTNGYELGVNGALTPAWKIAGGYAYQDAFVTSATAAARGGRAGGPGAAPHALAVEQLPGPSAESAAGVGVLYRADMFAAIDNTVDAARLHARGRGGLRPADARTCGCRSTSRISSTRRYYTNADSNANISPGFPG